MSCGLVKRAHITVTSKEEVGRGEVGADMGSADRPGRPTSPELHRPSSSMCHLLIGSLGQFNKALLQLDTEASPWLPPTNMRGGRNQDTHQVEAQAHSLV